MAKTLTGVDIMAVGKWNGHAFTEKDLDHMVEAFAESGIKPPLKLGHSENQRWFGQEDGAPALGWVEKLYKVGKKLVADFSDVPDIIIDLIRSGRYRAKSAEVYMNLEDNGKKWPRALKAVSLLGADLPAVTTLEDLRSVLMSRQAAESTSYADKAETRTYVYGGNMDGELEKRYKEEIAALTAKVADLLGKVTTFSEETASLKTQLSKMEERAVKAEVSIAAQEESHAVETFTAKVDGLVKAGKILPAEKDSLIRTFSALGTGVRKFGDKEFSPRADFLKSLEDRPKIVKFKEEGTGGSDTDEASPAIKVDRLVKKFMAEKKCSYVDAIELVKEAHSDVWLEYVRPSAPKED